MFQIYHYIKEYEEGILLCEVMGYQKECSGLEETGPLDLSNVFIIYCRTRTKVFQF